MSAAYEGRFAITLQPPGRCPGATIATYGHDSRLTTKLVVSMLDRPEQREPFATHTWTTQAVDVRHDPAIAAEVSRFVHQHGAKQTVTSDGILLRIEQISRGKLQIQQGSLYPALYRLEHQGFIASEWGESENKRKARFYRLTAAGRRQLRDEVAYWRRLSEAISLALAAAPEDA